MRGRQRKKGRLFKGYGWDIYKTEENKYPEYALVVFANHRVCAGNSTKHGASMMNCWWLGDNKTKCVICGAKVPDNIQALIALYTYGQETP